MTEEHCPIDEERLKEMADEVELSDEEWLAAYLMLFGTDTIDSAAVQKGETEFLTRMGQALRLQGTGQSAWWVIVRTYLNQTGHGVKRSDVAQIIADSTADLWRRVGRSEQ